MAKRLTLIRTVNGGEARQDGRVKGGGIGGDAAGRGRHTGGGVGSRIDKRVALVGTGLGVRPLGGHRASAHSTVAGCLLPLRRHLAIHSFCRGAPFPNLQRGVLGPGGPAEALGRGKRNALPLRAAATARGCAVSR
jgi:hypothetical protein